MEDIVCVPIANTRMSTIADEGCFRTLMVVNDRLHKIGERDHRTPQEALLNGGVASRGESFKILVFDDKGREIGKDGKPVFSFATCIEVAELLKGKSLRNKDREAFSSLVKHVGYETAVLLLVREFFQNDVPPTEEVLKEFLGEEWCSLLEARGFFKP